MVDAKTRPLKGGRRGLSLPCPPPKQKASGRRHDGQDRLNCSHHAHCYRGATLRCRCPKRAWNASETRRHLGRGVPRKAFTAQIPQCPRLANLHSSSDEHRFTTLDDLNETS